MKDDIRDQIISQVDFYRNRGKQLESIIEAITKSLPVLDEIENGNLEAKCVEELIREEFTLEYDSDINVLSDGPIKPWFIDYRKNNRLNRWEAY